MFTEKRKYNHKDEKKTRRDYEELTGSLVGNVASICEKYHG